MERDETQLLADVLALEPLSDDADIRTWQLHSIAEGEAIIMDVCPECGVTLEGLDITAHAHVHWPEYLDEKVVSREAKKRRSALLRAGSKQRFPAPSDDDKE